MFGSAGAPPVPYKPWRARSGRARPRAATSPPVPPQFVDVVPRMRTATCSPLAPRPLLVAPRPRAALERVTSSPLVSPPPFAVGASRPHVVTCPLATLPVLVAVAPRPRAPITTPPVVPPSFVVATPVPLWLIVRGYLPEMI